MTKLAATDPAMLASVRSEVMLSVTAKPPRNAFPAPVASTIRDESDDSWNAGNHRTGYERAATIQPCSPQRITATPSPFLPMPDSRTRSTCSSMRWRSKSGGGPSPARESNVANSSRWFGEYTSTHLAVCRWASWLPEIQDAGAGSQTTSGGEATPAETRSSERSVTNMAISSGEARK